MEQVIFLAATIVIEGLIAIALSPRYLIKRTLLAVALINLVTHPLGWYLVEQGTSWLAIEITITLVESVVFFVLFSKHRFRLAFAAIIMNVVTAAIGHFLF